MNERICWICGSTANSREHRAKRSDLKSIAGERSQFRPLYFHSRGARNRIIGSLNSDKLKWAQPICSKCNNTTTQKHDKAWELLSKSLQDLAARQFKVSGIQTSRFFKDPQQQLLGVHLYFVKQFGCCVVDANVQFPLGTLSSAIKSNRACPEVFLKFYWTSNAEKIIAGASDLKITRDFVSRQVVSASWIYQIHKVKVQVLYLKKQFQNAGTVDAWHPNHGNRLTWSCNDRGLRH